MRTHASGNSRTISAVHSVPLIPGNRRSIITRLGRCLRNASKAALPFPASATTSMSDSTFKDADRPMRTMKWSSTTRIRIGFEFFIDPFWGLKRNLHGDASPAPGLALDAQMAAHRLRALAHVEETEVPRGRRLPGSKPLAIINHGQRHRGTRV